MTKNVFMRFFWRAFICIKEILNVHFAYAYYKNRIKHIQKIILNDINVRMLAHKKKKKKIYDRIT